MGRLESSVINPKDVKFDINRTHDSNGSKVNSMLMSSLKQANYTLPQKELFTNAPQGGTAYFKLSVENLNNLTSERKARNSELEKKRVSFDVNNIK